MRIRFLKERFNLFIFGLYLYFLSVIGKSVMFYSIENSDIGMNYMENEGTIIFEFQLKNKYILKSFKSVFLLHNKYLKCILRNDQIRYYTPNTIKILDLENIILELSEIDEEKDNLSTGKYFLGQLSHNFLLRFARYATIDDPFITTLSFIEFTNILLVLEILGFKRTSKNNTFFKYLLVNSIVNENFDFTKFNIFLNSNEYDCDMFNMNLEYLYNIFLEVLCIGNTNKFTFLLLKSNTLFHDFKIIQSYQVYVRYKDKFCKSSIIFFDPNIIIHLEKLLTTDWGKNCFCFFSKYCIIDTFCFVFTKKEPSKKIFNLIYLIKPNNLKKIVVRDMLNNKTGIKTLLLFGYFQITEYLKISCDLNIEEISMILQHSENIKKLVIKSQDACYDILFELNKFAKSHKNMYLKYKCINLIMICQKNYLLQNLSENLIFYIKKFNESFLHCNSCFMRSFVLYRKIRTRLDNNNYQLEKYKNKFFLCSNVNAAYINMHQNKSVQIIHPKLVKYIFQIQKLQDIFFENIIITDILIRHILETKSLISIKIYNSLFPSELFHKYKIVNYTLRGITIKNTILTLNMNFIKFISLFRNLIFLKIHIKNIDSVFQKIIVNRASEMYKVLKYKSVSRLEYFKITINEDITTCFPIIFVFSCFFDISNLSTLVLQYFKLDEKDASVISNLKNLKELHVCVYQQKNEFFLDRLTKILENKMITRLGLDIKNLNFKIFEYLYNFRKIVFVSILFKIIEAYDLTLLHKMKLNYPKNIVFLCKNDPLVSFEVINFCEEHNIAFLEN
ncbi:hypothetical protein CWI37_0605p0020 [Hamiltosporidium tvaerminnensis]|uniref:Uncharacterized protein n=1 Tax=Hamiltosporidium tvaerminnensis TaxID=1176355 RepID=A0A4V2JUY0_9MICR|nr:hypothetical protein LUQ84_002573 [Hamiltosporidium tvaerminnensis]TBU01892.1 hypothetical protein CWI37_0605p0020 [Hamiltosporidium tvaerminnensis]